jgi:DNA repair protein RadC
VTEDVEEMLEPLTLLRPVEIAAFLWQRVFQGLDREAMCAVYFDHSRRVIGWTLAYVGCLTRCHVEPRGIVVPALLVNASALLIAHNHPSGTPEPSNSDKLFAAQVQMACDFLGLGFVDSMIISDGHPSASPRWSSMMARSCEETQAVPG